MLRWLLILAMAVLPWHGWAGGGLAAVPAPLQQQAAQASTFATGSSHEAHPGHASADCLDEVAAADHHAAAGTDGGCPGCSMCHSCSPVGLPAMTAVPPADSAPPQRLASAASRFASAERLPGLKPPIS
ncbi:hypothetical protein RAMLITH_16700 [Ramlibacter sp. RBP-2]|uniref:DUF2946 domain-containing protein n=1 Tax=Ramlibacter lithotrophicus TaxID=2606681 RepID=A0A7X6I7M2_9BURK|nr:hypothetical protein [Ramlibacter lithotrophicus]NKE67465.1 hypothetical protein [Ramlibacter lithotrophicus]